MGITWSIYGIGYKGPAPDLEGARGQRGQHQDTPIAVARTLPEPSELPDRRSCRGQTSLQRSSRPAAEGCRRSGDLVGTRPRDADQLKEQTGRLDAPAELRQGERETAAAVATELGAGQAQHVRRCRPTTSSSNTFTTGGKPTTHGHRPDRRASSRSSAPRGTLKNPTPYAVVQLQQAIPQVDQARPGRRRVPPPTRTPGDHRSCSSATSVRCAFRRSASRSSAAPSSSSSPTRCTAATRRPCAARAAVAGAS